MMKLLHAIGVCDFHFIKGRRNFSARVPSERGDAGFRQSRQDGELFREAATVVGPGGGAPYRGNVCKVYFAGESVRDEVVSRLQGRGF